MSTVVSVSATAFTDAVRGAVAHGLPTRVDSWRETHRDRYVLRVRIGERDEFRESIDGRLADLGRHALIEAGLRVVEYSHYVRECFEGIRDLVDQ